MNNRQKSKLYKIKDHDGRVGFILDACFMKGYTHREFRRYVRVHRRLVESQFNRLANRMYRWKS